jgi:hypothetical protein
MARTRGAEADPVDVVEEEIVLGPDEEEDLAEADAPEDEGDDAGGDADEQEGEGEEAEDVTAEPPAPRRGGGSQTIREQRRRAQEAEQRAAQLERELAEARGFQQGMQARTVDPQAAARAEQEFYASLEMMPPAQAYQALMQRGQQQIGNVVQNLQFQTNERLDKQAYDAAARTSRVHQQYRSQVESTLAAERAAGRNPDREVILKYLVGNDVLERANRAAPAQRTGAARRVASQRTQPTGARGDVAARGRGARLVPGTPEHDDWLVAEGIRSGHNVFE